MARFTLHAVAPLRPGLVAAVTQSLADLGCNLEDSRMSLLHGQLSMVLVVEAPGVANGTAIEEVLAPHLEAFALQLFVRPIAEVAEEVDLGHLVMVSVRGADHPGTVARVARAIAAAGGDIVDLVGHVVPGPAEIPSRLELTATLAPAAVPALRAGLEQLAAELGMHCDVEAGASRPFELEGS